MPNPQHPYFVVSDNPRFVDFQSEADERAQKTPMPLIRDFDGTYLAYDAAGNVWSIHYARRPSTFYRVTRFLAAMLSLGVSRAPITWTLLRAYPLEELRQHYLDAIAGDDDILTQFVGPEELSARVRSCGSFQDLVTTWEWQSEFHPNTENEQSA